MTETLFTINVNGAAQQLTRDQLWAVLSASSQITDVTVSVKETRWPVRAQGHEKFISARRDYSSMARLLECIPDWGQRGAARQMAMQAIQKDIVEAEEWLNQIMGFFWTKDNLTPMWRNPENPAVKAGWDVQGFLRGGGLNFSQGPA